MRHPLDPGPRHRADGRADVPPATNQDQRDAIAAAVTAREHTLGLTEAIGEIIVPAAREKKDA